MQLNELQTEFNQTFDELTKLFSEFDPAKINVKPSENKWSAAQVARHLIKSNAYFPKMVSGAGETPDRQPDAMIERLKKDFSDFNLLMEAADFLAPEEQIYDKDQLANSLETMKSEISQTVEHTDLMKVYKTIEFPVYGYLTGLESLAFVVYHTKRHIHQLNKLYETA